MAKPQDNREEYRHLRDAQQKNATRGLALDVEPAEHDIVAPGRGKVQARYAQAVPGVTASLNPVEVPLLKAPMQDVQTFRSAGPLDEVWGKVQNFVQNLENCDILGELESYKLQAYYYILPRFCMYRVQLFRDDKDEETPFVVELQRRDGDAFLTSQVFQQLKQAILEPVPDEFNLDEDLMSWTPDSDAPDFSYLDLSRAESDVVHWGTLLNQPNLESARSGSGCLALAAQTEQNHQYIVDHHEPILTGVRTMFQVSEDLPTVFACTVLLASLAIDSDWCNVCLENGMLGPILQAMIRWTGQEKLFSYQILLHFTITLRRLREFTGDEEFRTYLANEELQSSLETIHAIIESKDTKLQDDIKEQLGRVLFQF